MIELAACLLIFALCCGYVLWDDCRKVTAQRDDLQAALDESDRNRLAWQAYAVRTTSQRDQARRQLHPSGRVDSHVVSAQVVRDAGPSFRVIEGGRGRECRDPAPCGCGPA